jgi:HlyD family secretion protein
MSKKNKLKQTGIATLFIGVCIAAILFSEYKSKEQNIEYQTVNPDTTTITQKKIISGNIFPVKEIEVKSAIPGVLETYYVQLGDKVKSGDRIAKIKILSEPSQIENAKMNLNTTRIVYENDRLNFERDKELFDKGVITQTEFENSTKTCRMSKEQFEYAKNQLHLLQEGYIPSSNVSNVVVATAEGTIIALPLEEGSPVVERNNFRDGSTVALIARMDAYLFKGKVVENDVLTLKRGMKLTVMLTSMKDFKTEAVVRAISPKGYREQGIMKYDMEAVFTLPDTLSVYSGFNATVEYVVNERKNVLSIPESCLIFQNDSTYVEILKKGKFERKRIETGLSDGINIEVSSGIEMKDKLKKNP